MKLIMTLQSDALPGSGEGLSGIIDADVNYDEYGLPYIPAKRLKGILREAALDLCDAKKLTDSVVKDLFGKRGEQRGVAFRLSDGYLQNYQQIRAFLKECSKDTKKYGSHFHPQAVLDFYTYTRSQTAIEDTGESIGVAKDGSLRTFRVLKKGLTFEFECESLLEDAANLQLICSVTRQFGSSRTRGLGAISVRCDDSVTTPNTPPQNNEDDTQPPIQDDERYVCHLDIQTQGQILVTTEVGNDQISEAYLPGSFLLGAFAEAYIQHQLSPEDTPNTAYQDGIFRAIFLNGDVRFGNAYPVAHNEVYFPAPVSIVKEKDVNHFFDLTHSELDDNIQTKGGIGEFVVFNGGEAYTCSPEKEIEYHHYRPEENRGLGHAKKGDGQFFQFEVLAPHQQFQAEIIGTYAHLRVIQELIAKTPTVFLGKSKTAQYGKCSIAGTFEKLDPHKSQIVWKNDEKLVVTLASDMLLCNENGLIRPDPDCFKSEMFEWLKTKNPGLADQQIKIEIKHTFLKAKQIGGFVGIWRMPKIQVTALAAGSVIVFQNNSGQDLDVTELQHAAFGLRTEEGFGRIKLNWHRDVEINVVKKEDDRDPVFNDHLTTVTTLILYIIEQRIQAAIKAEANITKIRQIHETPVNAFLGKLRLFLNNSNNVEDFQRKCSDLKQRGRDHLMKLENVLYLQEQNRPQQEEKAQGHKKTQEQDEAQKPAKIIAVDLEKFDDFVNDLKQVQDIRDWKYAILQNADIDIDKMQQEHRFDWYKLYALHLITQLKFKNRKEGNRG